MGLVLGLTSYTKIHRKHIPESGAPICDFTDLNSSNHGSYSTASIVAWIFSWGYGGPDCIFVEKNPHGSGPEQLKYVLFKGQLYLNINVSIQVLKNNASIHKQVYLEIFAFILST